MEAHNGVLQMSVLKNGQQCLLINPSKAKETSEGGKKPRILHIRSLRNGRQKQGGVAAVYLSLLIVHGSIKVILKSDCMGHLRMRFMMDGGQWGLVSLSN